VSAYTRDVLARAAMPAPTGDAARFLAALGDGQHTFQTFADSRRDARLARVLHGTLAEHGEALRRLNARGAGVFVTVNRTDGKGRKAANILVVRAYFVDLDGAPLKPVQTAPLPPHIVLESSPGRWHAYWLLAPGAPLDTFKRVQQALALRFGADLKVCDLPRVMRLPGFQHRKRKTFQTRIVELRDAAGYAHAEFIEAFGIDTACTTTTTAKVAASAPARAAHKLPATIPQGERNNVLLSLAAAFVRKGVIGEALNTRMQRINAERCTPLLGADEVDTICEHATGYGSDGFLILAHKLLDSPGWRSLSPSAQAIALVAVRRGGNDAPFALAASDFAGLPGFCNRGAFYRHRKELLRVGLLQVAQHGRRTQHGCAPDLYLVATAARHGSLSAKREPSEVLAAQSRKVPKRNPALGIKMAPVVKSTNRGCALVLSCVPAKARTAPDTQTLAALCVLVDNRPLHIPSVADYYAVQVAA
jgi:hypothetical protein